MSSPYLSQALQSMQAAPAAQQAAIDPAILAQQIKAGKSWKAENPGKSYLGHNLQQAGQNVMAAPSRVAGLFDLGAKR
jgi:hypothetical protein